MDEQLRDALSVFRTTGVRYWADCGTLLALCREGELFPWDRDIDLACWDDEIPKLDTLVEGLREIGYKVIPRHYRGKPYKYKIRPSYLAQKRGARLIDLAIYRRYGDRAWCPGFYFTKSKHPTWSLRWFFDHGIRAVITEIWVRWFSKRDFDLRIPRMKLAMITWSVPVELFEQTATLEIDGTEVSVPARWEEYLELRYGEWRVPRTSWDFYRDDRTLMRDRPERAIADHLRSNSQGEAVGLDGANDRLEEVW